MKFVANVSPPSEPRKEQTSADLPMEQADSTIADPQTHLRFLLPPEEPSSKVLCTNLSISSFWYHKSILYVETRLGEIFDAIFEGRSFKADEKVLLLVTQLIDRRMNE